MKTQCFTAEVPSNIAIVKYWGKLNTELQWPANSSISMTLNQARTITTASVRESAADTDVITKDEVTLTPGSAAADKAYEHIRFLRKELGYNAPLAIRTHNTFPSECGIASSASGLGALTLAVVAAWTNCDNLQDLQLCGHTMPALAAFARIGSGSACRSFFGGFAEWEAGESADQQNVVQIASHDHWPLADLIVIVSDHKKAISSTQAHKTAWSSPLFRPRLAGINERLCTARTAIANKDLKGLGVCLESDALEMHAVMMTSVPPAKYMTSNSEAVLTWIRNERRAGNFDAWFTMDAGPNVHVICDAGNAASYGEKIRAKFPEFELISDSTGAGPVLYRGMPS